MNNRHEFERLLAKIEKWRYQNRYELNSKFSHLDEIIFTELSELYKKIDAGKSFAQDDILAISEQIIDEYMEKRKEYYEYSLQRDNEISENFKKEILELNRRLEK